MPDYNESVQNILQEFKSLLSDEQDQVVSATYESSVDADSYENLSDNDSFESYSALFLEDDDEQTPLLNNDTFNFPDRRRQVTWEESSEDIEENDFQNNWSFFKEQVLKSELKNEIEFINQLLFLESEDFADAFKARCRKRHNHPERYTNLSTVPQSPANELYWKITQLIFQPETMKDMLAILMPACKYALTVSLSEQIPAQYQTREERRTYLKSIKANPQNQPADIQIQAIDSLNEAADITRVSEFCFEEDMVFDVNQLNGLGIGTLSDVLKYIERVYPQLYKSILQHNHDLQVLKTDIDWYHNKGQSPAQALAQLIKGLEIGGEAYTGTIYASKPAIEAIGCFIFYFESLPKATQEQLRALTSAATTLGEIFDEQIAKGQCVETTASGLKKLMLDNADSEVLNNIPNLSLDYHNILLQKYTVDKKQIHPVKDLDLISILPVEWIETEISKFLINTDEQFIMLLLSFPPVFYERLLKNIQLANPQKQIVTLAESLEKGFFNSEQKTALVKALLTNFNKFETNLSMLQWAVKTTDFHIVSQTVDLIPRKKYFQELTKTLHLKGNITTVLHEACVLGSDILQKLIEVLAEDKCMEALYSIDIQNKSVFHRLANFPEEFIKFFNQLPEEKHTEIMRYKGDYSKPVIHCLKKNLEIILNIVSSLPETERLDVIQSVDEDRMSVLYYFLNNHEKLKKLIGLLPKEQRIAALTVEDKYHKLFIAELDSPVLIDLLKLVPRQMRFNLLTIPTRNKKPLLLSFTHYKPEDFQEIIKSLPAEKRVEALFMSIFCPDYVQEMVYLNPVSVEKYLYLMPEDDRSKAANLISANLDDKNLILFLKLIKDPIGFLNLLPERELADVLYRVDTHDNQYLLKNIEFLPNIAGKLNSSDHRMILLIQRLLQKVVHQPAQFKDLIDLLAKDEYLKALKLKDNRHKTVLHHCTDNPELLSEFLDMLPEETRFEIVNSKDIYMNSLLFYAAKINFNSFDVIIRSLPTNQRVDAALVTNSLSEHIVLEQASKTPSLLASILEAIEDKFERFKIVNTELSPGVSILSLSKENQPIREVLSNRIDKSILIKEAVYKANLKYSNYHHSGRKEGKYCRGRTGFFSGRRHGQTGLDNAQIFTDLMGRQTVLNEVCELLINKLEDKKTRFHRHSFASYVLDEMLDVLGLTGDETQNLSPNNLNKYDKAMLSNILNQLSSLKDRETVSNSMA